MTAGRPSSYSDFALRVADDYLVDHEERGDPVPTVEGLACEIGVSKQTIYTWAEANPEFLDALERIKSRQGRLLQAKGLRKEIDGGITKLMLSANHGMAEKSDLTSGGDKLQSGFIYMPAKKPEGADAA